MHTLKFCVDSLEPRRLLTGVVQVDYSADGDLSIIGDRADNSVVIARSSFGTEISGLDGTLLEFEGTQSNSLTLGTAGDEPRDLFIRMDRGDDQVKTMQLNITGKLDADLGRGNDVFTKDSGEFNGAAIIRGGRGNFDDQIAATGEFNGDVLIDSATAREFNFVELRNISINGDLTLTGRESFCVIDHAFFSQDMNINTRRSTLTSIEDAFVSGNINANQNGSELFVGLSETVVMGDLQVSARRDVNINTNDSSIVGEVQVDIVSGFTMLDNTELGGDVRIRMRSATRIFGPPASAVVANDCTVAGLLHVRMGAGASVVDLSDSQFQSASVELGSGKDILRIDRAEFNGEARFDGEGGFDQYSMGTGMTSQTLEFISFEEEIESLDD